MRATTCAGLVLLAGCVGLNGSKYASDPNKEIDDLLARTRAQYSLLLTEHYPEDTPPESVAFERNGPQQFSFDKVESRVRTELESQPAEATHQRVKAQTAEFVDRLTTHLKEHADGGLSLDEVLKKFYVSLCPFWPFC